MHDTVNAIVALDAILFCDWLEFLESVYISCLGSFGIVGMDRFCPPVAHYFLEALAGEREPVIINENGIASIICGPDSNGQFIGMASQKNLFEDCRAAKRLGAAFALVYPQHAEIVVRWRLMRFWPDRCSEMARAASHALG